MRRAAERGVHRCGVTDIRIDQDVVLDESTNWFFAAGDDLVKANKSNLLKLLPAEQSAKAENYLKQNKTSFDKEEDLKKLMAALGK